MPSRNRTTSMFNAVAIVSALHLLSEGVIPVAEGTGEPYSVNRKIVTGAGMAGAAGDVPKTALSRGLDTKPIPALNQVVGQDNPPDGEVVGNAPDVPTEGNNGTSSSSSSRSSSSSSSSTSEDTGPPGLILGNEGESTVSDSLQASVPKCNEGKGQIHYERIIDTVAEPANLPFDSIRLKESPSVVLGKCADLCLKQITSELNLQTSCVGFDFFPGKRISSYSFSSAYTETKCLAYRGNPNGQIRYTSTNGSSFHMREVCYEAAAVRTECKNQKYVMERVRDKSFLPLDHIVVPAASLDECQDKCLSQYADDIVDNTRVCRAGSWDKVRSICYHSSYTRRTHPKMLKPDTHFDYFENTCLSLDRRCPKNKLLFVKEVNKELGGAYDNDVEDGLTYDECRTKCLEGENLLCRSFEYDRQSQTCVISDEDSYSRPEELRNSVSDKNEYYQLICIDGASVQGEYVFEDSDTQQLNQRRYRDVRTAFQLFRNKKIQLGSGFRNSQGRTRTRLTLAECLDECLEERAFTCRSVTYSDRLQTCQLSEYDQLNGQLMYDTESDYYENLMENLVINQPSSGTASSSSVAGQRTGVSSSQGSGGVRESGPGSAGQTGLNRPLPGGRFSTVGQSGTRVSSTSFAGSNFGGSGDRLGPTASSSGSDRFAGSNNVGGFDDRRNDGSGDQRFRPSNGAFDDRRNLFDSRDRFTTGRQTSAFGIDNRRQAGTFGFDTRRQVSGSFGGSRQTESSTGTRGTANSPMENGEDAKSDSGISGNSIGFGGSSSGSSGSNRPFRGDGGSSFSGGSSGSFPSGGQASSRCLDSDSFTPVGTRLRLRSPYIRDYVSVNSLSDCKRECLNQISYTCRSFNYRYATSRSNCELSDEDTSTILRLNNPSHFETDGSSDFFERDGHAGTDCLDVTQLCTEDGMEFTLRTDEPFRGRIYANGYYDRCFSRGSGSSNTVLKISGSKGFPDCGTYKYGDTTTNIVVVQFSDNVQTSLDKRYNLTCTIVGPGEAVVTSGYIGAGSGVPTPIEYLPAENQLRSKVRLQILYGGRPTTTIAVGDPLTFRLESQRGFNLVSDIFATNVVAKDPSSGRTVDLIDSRGCPLDTYVFPSLGRDREGNGLEARFNAFKIPQSNFLIFEATVRTCRGGCQPARCTIGPGREESESYGRRRRSAEDGGQILGDEEDEEEEQEEQVTGVYEVYLSREEIEDPLPLNYLDEVCLATAEYYGLVSGLIITVICLFASILAVGFCYRKQRQLGSKNALADAGNPYHHQGPGPQQQQQQQHLQQKSKFAFPGSHARTLTQPARQVYFPSNETTTASPQGEDGAATSSRYPDPSEPIYTDPGLFERARSQRALGGGGGGEVHGDASNFSSRRRFAEGED